MPVERKPQIPPRIQEMAELVRALREEYILGEKSTHSEPRIIIDETSPNGPIHVTVIWSKWAGMTHRERSGIIMDALDDEKVMPAREIMRITVAMGMTEDEWKRFQGA